MLYFSKFRIISVILISLFFILIASSNLFKFENKESSFEWMKFDKITLNNLIQNNKIVLLDFTADWCITCQLNKKPP